MKIIRTIGQHNGIWRMNYSVVEMMELGYWISDYVKAHRPVELCTTERILHDVNQRKLSYDAEKTKEGGCTVRNDFDCI